MRRINLIVILAAWTALLGGGVARAEGTLLAHYTLDGTAADALGNYADADLYNTLYEDGGVYLNGIYGGDPGGSSVITPQITALDFAAFSASIEFKISELPGTNRPILVGGGLWRWMSAYLWSDGRPFMRSNVGVSCPGDVEAVTLNEWHTAALIYDGSEAMVTIDGAPVCSAVIELNHGEDREFLTADGGAGLSFRGHVRNLKVYNGVESSLASDRTTLDGFKALFR